MKKYTKWLKSLCITAMVFTLVASSLGFEAYAQGENPVGSAVALSDGTGSSSLTVVKLRVAGDTTEVDYDGTKIPDQFKDAQKIPNVKFTYFRVNKNAYDAMMANPGSYSTVEAVEAALSKPNGTYKGTTRATDANGSTTVSGLKDGYYWFVESSRPEDYDSSLAVPFGIKLPAYVNGSKVSAITVYPKNTTVNPFDPTAPTPTLKKEVVKGTTAKRNDSFDFDETVGYKITAQAPKAVHDLQKLIFRDKLSNKLDIVSDSLEVKSNGVALTSGDDYTVDNSNQMLTITFTAAGIAKLTPEKNIVITYNAKINEANAVMGQPIPNGVQVIYSNESNNFYYSQIPADPNLPLVGEGEQPTAGSNYPDFGNPDGVTEITNDNGMTPYAEVGGKAFVKVSEDAQPIALSGAQFAVLKASGNKLMVLTETNNAYGWAEIAGVTTSSTNDEVAGAVKNITGTKVLTSAETTGAFEIKGLAYGDYKLVELQAPKYYATPSDTIAFTVSKNSYTTRQDVANRKYSMPKTGGIGTTIFYALGSLLVLAGVCGFFLSKRKKERAER